MLPPHQMRSSRNLWTTMFADNVVICDENREQVEEYLEVEVCFEMKRNEN